MNDQSNSIKQATIGIAVLVLVSKGIGFLREIIIAYRFGTGREYDVYLIAVSVPIALYSLFGYAFSNLFIPRYSYAVADGRDRTGLGRLWRDLNLAMATAVAITGLIIVFAPWLLVLIAPGLKAEAMPEAVLIVRWSAIIVVLGVAEAFFRSVLNAEKRFFIPAAGPILANIVLIASILLFSDRLSTRAILYGLVLGYLAQTILVYIPFLRTGVTRFFQARLFHHDTRTFVNAAMIALAVETAAQLYAIIDRFFASSMPAGIVSALGYTYLLIMLPVAIFAYALTTALFPFLSDAFAAGDRDRSAHLLFRGLSVSLLLAVPTMLVIWIFSDQLVTLLFRRGAFNLQSVDYTSTLLQYFALSLPGQFLLWILSRAYYGARRYVPLVINVIVMMAAKIIFAALITAGYGYVGLAISSGISYTIGAILLLAGSRRYVAHIDGRGLALYFVKVVAAAAAAYPVARLLHGEFAAGWQHFSQLIIGLPLIIAASLAVFVAVGYLLGIPDLHRLHLRPFRKRV
jgi:putative peptidoglycan lipid II flippase